MIDNLIYLSTFFGPDKLFDPAPPASNLLSLTYLICFGVMTLLAIGWFFLKGDVKQILSGLFTIFMTIGITGLLYTFVRYESLANLSARIVLDAIVLSLVIWLIVESVVITKMAIGYSQIKVVEDKYNKYLPKKKK